MKSFKKVNSLIYDITKKINKRHDYNYLLILKNWNKMVGENLSDKTYPEKINRYNILIVSVESEFFLEFQYKTADILKKINALLKSKTICKIKLVVKN